MLTTLTLLAVLAAEPLQAKQIVSDYDENPLRGDALYKGKELEVTGKVKSVALDPGGTVLVYLQGEMFTKFLAATKKDPRLATLRKGDKVTFRCTIHGQYEGDVLGEVCTLL